MEKESINSTKTHRITLIDQHMSGQEARDLILKLVNGRIDYHRNEQFSISVRSGQGSLDHHDAIALLQDARRQVSGAIRDALEKGRRVHITGNLIIDLPDEDE